jgi:hypothetical protein
MWFDGDRAQLSLCRGDIAFAGQTEEAVQCAS